MLDGEITDILEANSLSLRPDHIDIYSSRFVNSSDVAAMG